MYKFTFEGRFDGLDFFCDIYENDETHEFNQLANTNIPTGASPLSGCTVNSCWFDEISLEVNELMKILFDTTCLEINSFSIISFTAASNDTATDPLQNTSQYSPVITELVTELFTVYEDTDSTTLESSTERGTRIPRDAHDDRACRYQPCLDNGDCILDDSARGYRCDCRPGYSGKILFLLHNC